MVHPDGRQKVTCPGVLGVEVAPRAESVVTDANEILGQDV